MKERLLLLCMTYPTKSKKYGASVCMAGITDKGEFRRIYPVPYETFMRRSDRFHKRYYIEYEIREKGDSRKESYKVYPGSIRVEPVNEDYEIIRELCRENAKSIYELESERKKDHTSLGIIKPSIIDFIYSEKPLDQEKEVTKQTYFNPNNNSLSTCWDVGELPENLGHNFYYKFYCSENCEMTKGHICTCLDTEVGQLYRKMKEKYPIEIALEKVKERFFDWMATRELYFMMGTHSYHPHKWMIISILYPKRDTDLISSSTKLESPKAIFQKKEQKSLFDY